METRFIGELEVGITGLGCNNFGSRLDARQSAEVVKAALEAGVTMFDTADYYAGSEEYLGKALGKLRSQVTIASKFGQSPPPGVRGGSRRYVLSAAEASLRRLGTDYVDLYLLHKPDDETPVAETLGAMNELVLHGKVREIGCSKMDVFHLEGAAAAAEELGVRGFVNVQNEYSLLQREAEKGVLEHCQKRGISFVPFWPLSRGLLTGKYRLGVPPPAGTRISNLGDVGRRMLSADGLATVGRLERYALDAGHSLLDLALSYLSCAPAVACVIAGASTPEQLRANVAATAAWCLTAEERDAVAAIAGRGPTDVGTAELQGGTSAGSPYGPAEVAWLGGDG